MTIKERFDLLDGAKNFFSDLSKAWGVAWNLWKYKATAIECTQWCLNIYREDVLDWDEFTEETLKEWLATVIDEDIISTVVQDIDIDDMEKDFFLWWLGLAIWILQWDKETIDWFNEQKEAYNNL